MSGEVIMSINDLADFLFLKNTNNIVINLSIKTGLDNARDLFCFCFDLFCKGLVLVCGDGQKVDIHSLTQDDIGRVNSKLHLAGIKANVQVFPAETPLEDLRDLWIQNFLNVQSIRESSDSLRFEDYHFDLQTCSFVYKVSFEIVHNVEELPKNMVL
jgi:hypothetical protein